MSEERQTGWIEALRLTGDEACAFEWARQQRPESADVATRYARLLADVIERERRAALRGRPTTERRDEA